MVIAKISILREHVEMLMAGQLEELIKSILADVVAEYLAESGPYTPYTDGRITMAE